jgi:hypothetical protein
MQALFMFEVDQPCQCCERGREIGCSGRSAAFGVTHVEMHEAREYGHRIGKRFSAVLHHLVLPQVEPRRARESCERTGKRIRAIFVERVARQIQHCQACQHGSVRASAASPRFAMWLLLTLRRTSLVSTVSVSASEAALHR